MWLQSAAPPPPTPPTTTTTSVAVWRDAAGPPNSPNPTASQHLLLLLLLSASAPPSVCPLPPWPANGTRLARLGPRIDWRAGGGEEKTGQDQPPCWPDRQEQEAESSRAEREKIHPLLGSDSSLEEKPEEEEEGEKRPRRQITEREKAIIRRR